MADSETRFLLEDFAGRTPDPNTYLPDGSVQTVYIYHSYNDKRAVFGVFFSSHNKVSIFVVDTVVNNQLGSIKYGALPAHTALAGLLSHLSLSSSLALSQTNHFTRLESSEMITSIY